MSYFKEFLKPSFPTDISHRLFLYMKAVSQAGAGHHKKSTKIPDVRIGRETFFVAMMQVLKGTTEQIASLLMHLSSGKVTVTIPELESVCLYCLL